MQRAGNHHGTSSCLQHVPRMLTYAGLICLCAYVGRNEGLCAHMGLSSAARVRARVGISFLRAHAGWPDLVATAHDLARAGFFSREWAHLGLSSADARVRSCYI